MKEKIIKLLAEAQITSVGLYTRSDEYKGFWLDDDDATLFTHENIRAGLDATFSETKPVINDLRIEGFLELIHAVDSDYKPYGSGFSLTFEGLKYAVDNNLITP